MSAASRELINVISSPRSAPTLLRDLRELVGDLEDVQPWEDGLVHIRVAGLDRLVPDELEAKLNALRGRSVSVLRSDMHFSVMEVPA